MKQSTIVDKKANHMSVREWLHQNALITTLVAILLICVAAAVSLWLSRANVAGISDAYHFDPGTEAIFLADRESIPPVETPSGTRDGLRAYVYACGECPAGSLDGMTIEEVEQAGAFVANLRKHTEQSRDIRQRMRDGETLGEEELGADSQTLVRRPTDDRWFADYTNEAEAITNYPERRCREKDQVVRTCWP